MMKVNYQIHDQKTENGTASIAVTDGKFKGFVYRYGVIKIGEEEDSEGNLPLYFEYTLEEAPSTYQPVDEEAEKIEFEQIVGNILYDIMVNQAGKVGVNVNRNNDSEQSS